MEVNALHNMIFEIQNILVYPSIYNANNKILKF